PESALTLKEAMRPDAWPAEKRNLSWGSRHKALGIGSEATLPVAGHCSLGGMTREHAMPVLAPFGGDRERPPARTRNLGGGVPLRVPCGQGGDGLKRRQRARGRVQPIAGDATALFVGKVEDVQGRVKTKVARAQKRFRLHSGRRVGGQTAGVFVESELQDG